MLGHLNPNEALPMSDEKQDVVQIEIEIEKLFLVCIIKSALKKTV